MGISDRRWGVLKLCWVVVEGQSLGCHGLNMCLTCLVLLDLNLMELTVVLKVFEMLGNQLCLIMASLFF